MEKPKCNIVLPSLAPREVIWRTFRRTRAHCGSRLFPAGLALHSICGLCWRLWFFQTETLVALLLYNVPVIYQSFTLKRAMGFWMSQIASSRLSIGGDDRRKTPAGDKRNLRRAPAFQSFPLTEKLVQAMSHNLRYIYLNEMSC